MEESNNLKIFDLLCDRARELIFISLENDCSIIFHIDGLEDDLLDMTPIEQIFYVASKLYGSRMNSGRCKHFYLEPQYKIKTKNKIYVADFLIETTVIGNE